jgi:hypothetical protein
MQTLVHFNSAKNPVGVLVLWLGLLTFISGCGSQEGARNALPSKVGASGELVVVCSNDVWKSAAGDTIRSIFNRPFLVLPQYEPQFDLVHLTPDAFDRFWKPHRNILELEVADRVDTQTAQLKIYRDKYSRHQIYMEGKARHTADLALAIAERNQDMLSVLHRAEVERFAALVKLDYNEVIQRELAQGFDVELMVPRDARWAKRLESFGWIDRQLTRMKGGDNHDVQQGYFIYTEPYTSDSLFSMNARISVRNSMLRKYVKGPTPLSYMTTELRYVPSYEEVVFNGEFASELRGLWKMENDYMGGPFYSLTTYDRENGMLVTVEGYAYAPYFDKREYMREVEAAVRSLNLNPTFVDETAAP